MRCKLRLSGDLSHMPGSAFLFCSNAVSLDIGAGSLTRSPPHTAINQPRNCWFAQQTRPLDRCRHEEWLHKYPNPSAPSSAPDEYHEGKGLAYISTTQHVKKE